MKKIISISLAVLMLISCCVVAANAASVLKYTLRIEGVKDTLYYGDWTQESTGDDDIVCSVADALKTVNDSPECKITVTGLDTGYVSEINGEKAGQFGGYDGWYYSVNGEVPSVGMADYKLKNGDNVVVYYGDYPCQIPVLDDSESASGILKVKSYDTDWSTGEAVSAWAPVVGAKLYVDGDEYKTDKDGIVKLTEEYSGNCDIQIEKYSEKGAPQVCRFPFDYSINIKFKPAPQTKDETTTGDKTTSKTTTKTTKKTAKKANNFILKASKKTVKAKKLKKKSITFKAIKVKNAKGKITYAKVRSGSTKSVFKKLKIKKKSGKITLKKGKYKKGTIKLNVKVTAKGNSKYKSKTKSIVVKIKVK